MKKIYSLNISRLNNNQHFSYMQLVVAACATYAIIGEQFSRLVAALRAAFAHEDYVFKRHDRNAISERLQGAETERCRLFRHMRDFIKTYLTCSIAAKVQTADILLKVISLYGGGDIPSMKADERSAAIFNLVDDFEKDYPEQVAELGCTEMVTALKEANQSYIDIVAERAQYDSEYGLAMVAEARKQTDAAYHALVAAVNAAETVDADGELVPFIDYMNVNVRHYRMKIGQSLADMDGGTASGGTAAEGEVYKNATFIYAGGTEVKRRVEVGTPLVAPSNTEGYKWQPEVPTLMPKRSVTFREVPLDDREVTLTFHFLEHSEEELRGVVGSALEAPLNTEGCHWEPEVPTVFPEEDVTFNEVLDEAGGETGGNGGSTGGSTETPTDPTKILLLFNDGAHGNVIVKRMEVEPGYQLTAADLPAGYVYAFKADDQADIDAASPGDAVWVTLSPRG